MPQSGRTRDGSPKGAGAKRDEQRGYTLLRNVPRWRGTPKPSPCLGHPRFHRLRKAPAGASAPRCLTPTEGRRALYGTLTNRPPVGCLPMPCRLGWAFRGAKPPLKSRIASLPSDRWRSELRLAACATSFTSPPPFRVLIRNRLIFVLCHFR